ncbi:leucyl aminopeptidase [Candidatus Aenigmatarchaeota archaeon]
MKVHINSKKPHTFSTELLTIAVYEKEINKETLNIDKMLHGTITKIIKTKKFKGEFCESYIITTHGKLMAESILLLGLGKRKEFDNDKLRKIAAISVKTAKSKNSKTMGFFISDLDENKAQAITEGALLGNYQFTKFKTIDKEKIKKVDSFTIVSSKSGAEKGVETGKIISESVNYTRNLVNMPPSRLTPKEFLKEAKKIAHEGKLKIKIIDKNEMKKLGMNCFLAVSRGSSEEPYLVILEYNGGKKKVALAGKGITFDSGGLNLKPTGYMIDMKSDMGGAATVLGTMKTIAKLKPKLHVIGAMALSENMPGQSAIKPGDVVKSYNGKTVEINNTDAEGRLVLSDTLSYTERQYNPDAIIDLATLTGACVVALGNIAAGLMGSDEKLIKKIKSASKITSEKVWQLPLWVEYKELIKGTIGDIVNASRSRSMGPGTITAAAFLNNFVEKTPWAHLDIAGTAFIPEEREYEGKDATGWGVRLLTQLILDW